MLEQFDLTKAERDYLVANTPLFLARRLQLNPVVTRISSELTSEQILSELKTYATHRPDTIFERVAPYVLLVALYLKRDLVGLKNSTLIVADWHHRWFDYIRTALIQMSRSVSTSTIPVPNIGTTLSSAKTQASANFTTLKLPNEG